VLELSGAEQCPAACYVGHCVRRRHTHFYVHVQAPQKRARRTPHSAKGIAGADPDAPSTLLNQTDAPALPDAQRPAEPGSRPLSRLGSALAGADDQGGKEATLPLAIDTVIRTKWLDGEYHLARVVSVRDKAGAKDAADKEYYMHYVNMNRRMDTWVTADVMDLSWAEYDGIDEKRCAQLAHALSWPLRSSAPAFSRPLGQSAVTCGACAHPDLRLQAPQRHGSHDSTTPDSGAPHTAPRERVQPRPEAQVRGRPRLRARQL
jgi:RNA binding activity-knot of a chromodomain